MIGLPAISRNWLFWETRPNPSTSSTQNIRKHIRHELVLPNRHISEQTSTAPWIINKSTMAHPRLSGFRMKEICYLYVGFGVPWWNEVLFAPESKVPKTMEYLRSNFTGEELSFRMNQISREFGRKTARYSPADSILRSTTPSWINKWEWRS